jgi:hypothetical protein
MRLPVLVGERDPILRAGKLAFLGLLVGAVLGGVVSLAWFETRPLTYASTVALELSPVAPLVDLNPTGPRIDEVTVDTDATLAVSEGVAETVAATTGLELDEVARHLSVRARPLSRVLEVTYTTTISADAAREGATAAAESFLDLRDRLVIDPVRQYLADVSEQTISVQNQNEDARAEAEKADDVTVSQGQAALERRLERAQRFEVELPVAGTVVAAASAPSARRGTVDVVLVTGAGLGALLGFAFGLAWESRRRRAGLAPDARHITSPLAADRPLVDA